MEGLIVVAALGLVVALACAPLGAWIGVQKRRSGVEGAVFGFLLGPLGLLIVALLPTGEGRKPRAGKARLTLLSDAPDQPWLSEISDKPAVPREEAWLKELENRHRKKQG